MEAFELCRIIEKNQVLPGDVLVAYSSSVAEKSALLGYSHAAICCGEGIVAESCVRGVRKNTIDELLEEYEHIAIFRQIHFWNESRLIKLNEFIDTAIASKARFNSQGIRDYEKAKIEHEINLQEKLTEFFDDEFEPPDPNQGVYFCSELVAAAFIAVGILAPSAAVVFDPRVMSPLDLARDATYGLFVGYLIPYEGYTISKEDPFYYQQSLDYILRNGT